MKKDREERQTLLANIALILQAYEFDALICVDEASCWAGQPLAAILLGDPDRRGAAEQLFQHQYPDDSWVQVFAPTPVQRQVFGAPEAEPLFILESDASGAMFGAWISKHEVQALMDKLDREEQG